MPVARGWWQSSIAAQKAGKQFPYPNHNPDFFVDLAAIPLGAKIDTVAALGVLGK